MNKSFNSKSYADPFELNHIERIRADHVLRILPKSSCILDVGCGDGYIMEIFRANGHDVEGIELADNAIKKARKKGFIVHDASLSEPWHQIVKKKYNVVFGGEIIEHIFDTDFFLAEIKHVLKKHGSLILTTPNIAALGRRILLLMGKPPHIEITARAGDAGHVRYFTRESLRALLEEHGFEILSMESSLVNFSNDGKQYSRFLARVFPAIGNNIIVHARLTHPRKHP